MYIVDKAWSYKTMTNQQTKLSSVHMTNVIHVYLLDLLRASRRFRQCFGCMLTSHTRELATQTLPRHIMFNIRERLFDDSGHLSG